MIVVGVLVALAVDAWWSSRLDTRLADNYRERLAGELAYNATIASTVLEHTARILAATDSLEGYFDEDGVMLSADRVIVNLYNATRRYGRAFRRSTFDDAINTGNLRLIRDPALRDDLAILYDRMSIYGVDWYGLEFRNAARRALPISFQLRVRDECPPIVGDEWDGCPLDVSDDWAAGVLGGLSDDDDLRGAYRVQAHELAIFVRDMNDILADLKAMIEYLRSGIVPEPAPENGPVTTSGG